MKFSITRLLALAPLASAFPALTWRQTSTVQITGVQLTGDGCPNGTYSTDYSPDRSTLTVGFDAYQVAIGDGAPPQVREEHCELFLTLRYPVGCSSGSVAVTYHYFAALSGGVTATETAQYNLSPGSTVGSNPPPAVFPSGSTGVFTKSDTVVTAANIQAANQQDVSFVARTRVYLQAPGPAASGSLSIDDVTFTVSPQTRTCPRKL